jgi:hypothetical protein
MKKVLLLALLAGGVSQAVAQTSADQPGTIQIMEPGFVPGVGYRKIDGRFVRMERESFSNRAVGVVYDNATAAGGSGRYTFTGAGIGNKQLLDDTGFTPGPWATQAVRNLASFDMGLCNTGAAGAYDVLFEIIDTNDNNFVGQGGANNPMVVTTATPLAEFIYTGFNFAVNNGALYTAVDIPGADVAVPAGDAGVVIRLTVGTYDAGTDTFTPATGAGPGGFILACNSGTVGPSAAFADYRNSASVGFTEVSYGRDVPVGGVYDTIVSGNAVINAAAPGNDRRATSIAAGAGFQWYNMMWGWRGDIGATAPACESFAFGADNAFASDSETLAANGVKWYCLTLAGDVIDENNQYIDFDTEGSTADAAIAIYNSEGTVVTFDDDSGSGVNAQLSFGMGRRAAEGDGLQYDGRNFDDTTAVLRGLGAGTYYVAVAASSAVASFGDGFSATGNGDAGAVTLRVRSNQAGGALDPSVAPIATRIVGISAEDPILAPGGQTPNVALFGPGVIWYDVQICTPSSADLPITISESAATSALNSRFFIFDGAGNLVSDQTGSAAARATVTFTDAPVLAAGTYYIAHTYLANDLNASPETDGRWHLRPRSGDAGFAFQLDIAVGYSECAGGGPSCDYDYNQDENVDLTDAQQMAQVFVGLLVPEANWLDGDLNGDENADLTDAQILASYVVTGTCGL